MTFDCVLGHRADAVDFFDEHAQDFSDAPGLRDAPSGTLRSVAVEDLGDVAEAGIGEMSLQGSEPFGSLTSRLVAASVHLIYMR